jgi:hypothetical protein
MNLQSAVISAGSDPCTVRQFFSIPRSMRLSSLYITAFAVFAVWSAAFVLIQPSEYSASLSAYFWRGPLIDAERIKNATRPEVNISNLSQISKGGLVQMPIEFHAKKTGIELRFTSSLDTQSAIDSDNWNVEVWNYLWSPAYGSPEISTIREPEKPSEAGGGGVAQFTQAQISKTAHDSLKVKSVTVGTDDRSVFLEVEGMKPVMQMSIRYSIKSADGSDLKGEVVNTIHALGE